MDISAISAVLGSIKTATDIAKLIKDSGISLKDAETKLKLAELISALADAKIEIAEVEQTLINKDSELRKLQDQLEIKGKIHWEPPYYWVIDNDKKEGPYCQQCYDKNHELIRLQDLGDGVWRCFTCNNNYTDSTYRASIGAEHSDDYDPLNS
jgi:hypothetical protein